MIIDEPAVVDDGPVPAVLFDLDGTLVDPAGGITGGIAHALRVMDLPVPGPEVLNRMVGPKLADGLVGIVGVPEPLVPDVIAAYRSWYSLRGMAMSRVYPGIPELLGQLRAGGVRLAVATQKPEALARTLLAHHGLADSFDVIRGSHTDESLMPGEPGYRAGKAEIIGSALEWLGGQGRSIMVGDRHQDVNGARANGLDCIGVAWGFAPEGELEAAGVAGVVQTAEELLQAVARELGTGMSAATEAAHGPV
ncbi:HAD hydrolase-like protein [Arthrobacter livingstonensis]|uniref:HAD hydrolase-like protein n=1 Tax=Arthrobacter livingstonensis TaxID=670078 RepID=UPI001FECA0B1|nr:HAD hydrolase-like protein [Arthrobacter livingstonensis]